MTRASLRCLCTAISLAVAPVAHAQNLVQDGDFETGVFGSIPSWTISQGTDGTDPLAVPVNCGTNRTTSRFHSGAMSLRMGPYAEGDLQYFCKVSQKISTVAGQTYQFSFWLLNNYGAEDSAWQAWVDGTTVVSGDMTQGWQEYTHQFTAARTPTTIAFNAWNKNGYMYIDDVSVSVVEAPEPSSYALMVAGLAGLGVVARRRRRAVVA